jgi:endonuclease/exonuclease/phosphatase family metal-dependent hydrolase
MQLLSRAFVVATYNIHHGHGVDGAIDLERTAATIRSTGAEIVALQELDRGLPRSGGIDQVAKLERLTDMHIGFFPTVRRAGGQYGVGIASLSPLDAVFEALPLWHDEEPRGVIVARRGDVAVLATHLSTHAASQRVQNAALAAMVRAIEGPVVVLGDLNQRPRRLRALAKEHLDGPRGRRLRTYPAARPRVQLDHVLAGRGAVVTRAWTIPSRASDHLPLVAEIQVA